MTAAPMIYGTSEATEHPRQLSTTAVTALAALQAQGHSLIPLGGPDGKAPLVAFAGRKRLPLPIVLERLRKGNSAVYGLRLHNLIVVDLDTGTPAAREYAERRFGVSPLTVKTPRGLHSYYRAGEKPRQHVIRENGIAIDVKAGANSYVAGPGSIRPDGGAYVIERGSLEDLENLPRFHDSKPLRTPSLPQGNRVPVGSRTVDFLWPKSREFAETADSETNLAAELRAAVDWHCEDSETITDAEIAKSAKWGWRLRLDGNLWGGAMSAAKIHAHEVSVLLSIKNGTDALGLLHELHRCHASKPGKRFAVATEAMADAGFHGWSRWRIRQALKVLLQAGLLRQVRAGSKWPGPSLYQLNRLPLNCAENGKKGFLLHCGGSTHPRMEG